MDTGESLIVLMQLSFSLRGSEDAVAAVKAIQPPTEGAHGATCGCGRAHALAERAPPLTKALGAAAAGLAVREARRCMLAVAEACGADRSAAERIGRSGDDSERLRLAEARLSISGSVACGAIGGRSSRLGRLYEIDR